jgi:hypothetical protein
MSCTVELAQTLAKAQYWDKKEKGNKKPKKERGKGSKRREDSPEFLDCNNGCSPPYFKFPLT